MAGAKLLRPSLIIFIKHFRPITVQAKDGNSSVYFFLFLILGVESIIDA